jgi:hypothetical protein
MGMENVSMNIINENVKRYSKRNSFLYILTHMTIARPRLCKNFPEVKLLTIEGHPLLGNGPINTRL